MVYLPQFKFPISEDITMIEFQKLDPKMREEYERYLLQSGKGCEYSFANLSIWGRDRKSVV